MNTLLMTTLILSGTQVVLSLVAIGTVIGLGTMLTKQYLLKESNKIKNIEREGGDSPLVRKYEEVDIQQHMRNIKLAGLATSVALVLVVFAWTQVSMEKVLSDFGFVLPEEIVMDVPVTSPPEPELPPALPPPVSKPSVVIEIDDTKPEPKEEPKIEEPVISPTPSTYTGPTDVNSKVLPPTIEIVDEPEEPVVEEVEFTIVEQMPRFPGCEEEGGGNKAKKACADQRLLQFINKNIRYPQMAVETEIEGMAVISFVVNKDGSISDMKVLRDPGGGCGKEALRVVRLMNKMPQKWTPGKQRGKAVMVRYNLPVKFRLN